MTSLLLNRLAWGTSSFVGFSLRMNPPDRLGFHPRIEALRGIAAMLVAGSHSSQAPLGRLRLFSEPVLDASEPIWGMLARAMRYALNAHGAVILFFVLSGFVLSLSLDRGPSKLSASARRFFIARIFRLYPGCFFAVSLFALLYFCVGASLPNVDPTRYSLSSILRNALLLDHSINGVMWTVQIELWAMPLVFAAHRLRRRVGEVGVVALSVALVPVLFSAQLRAWIHPVTFAFMFGMLVPSVGRALVERLSRRWAAVLASLTVAAFFLARPTVLHMGYDPTFAWLPEGSAAAVFIALLVYGPALGAYRVLDIGLVRFYGKISYSFYLLHPLTLLVIWKIPETIQSWIEVGVPSAVIALMLWLVTSAAITPLAAAAYLLVERPGLWLGRRLGAPTSRVPKLELTESIAH